MEKNNKESKKLISQKLGVEQWLVEAGEYVGQKVGVLCYSWEEKGILFGNRVTTNSMYGTFQKARKKNFDNFTRFKHYIIIHALRHQMISQEYVPFLCVQLKIKAQL